MILYKVGLFGIAWDTRPSSTTRRPSSSASTRRSGAPRSNWSTRSAACAAPSQIDQNLQDARGAVTFDEETWYFGMRPVRPEDADAELLPHGDRQSARLQRPAAKPATPRSTRAPTIWCSSSTASPATSARPRTCCAIRSRATTIPAGSTRAPTTASGSPTASSTPTTASSMRRARDFQEVIATRGLAPLVESQRGPAARRPQHHAVHHFQRQEAGWIMPTHLATMGFYVLRRARKSRRTALGARPVGRSSQDDSAAAGY